MNPLLYVLGAGGRGFNSPLPDSSTSIFALGGRAQTLLYQQVDLSMAEGRIHSWWALPDEA